MNATSKPHIAITLESELQKLDNSPTSCCIYTVPEVLRKGNGDAYTPQIISIGPYHSKRSNLKGMNFHKKRYLRYFLQRTNAELVTYVKLAQDWEPKVREYYDGDIELNSDELVQMILMDGIFLLEFVLRISDEEHGNGDELLMKTSIKNDLIRDLMLLENQIPLFIFEGLYKSYKDGDDWTLLLISFCAQYLSPKGFIERKFRDITVVNLKDLVETEYMMHLVDLLHFLCTAKIDIFKRNFGEALFGRQFALSRSASELQEAGLSFVPMSVKSYNDLHLHVFFDDKLGELHIAPLSVNRHTESIFRNVIAYEHCHHKHGTFRSYVILMDCLINTARDVDLLIKSKILTNYLESSEDVATLFNNLYKITMMDKDNFCFSEICSQLNYYSRNCWHRHKARWFRWRQSLSRDYCNSPWSAISIIAAFVLLLLTALQTVASFSSANW